MQCVVRGNRASRRAASLFLVRNGAFRGRRVARAAADGGVHLRIEDAVIHRSECRACVVRRGVSSGWLEGSRPVGYRSCVRLRASDARLALKASLTTRAVRNTTTARAAVETMAAISASACATRHSSATAAVRICARKRWRRKNDRKGRLPSGRGGTAAAGGRAWRPFAWQPRCANPATKSPTSALYVGRMLETTGGGLMQRFVLGNVSPCCQDFSRCCRVS
jgi:hypothetical protein